MDLVVVTANTSFGIKLGAIIVALSVAASQEPTGFSHGLAGCRAFVTITALAGSQVSTSRKSKVSMILFSDLRFARRFVLLHFTS